MGDYPAAIVWDLDGTLIDSAPDIAGALNRLLQENGLPAQPESEVRTMIGDGVAKLIERGFRGAGRVLQLEAAQRLARRFMEIYWECATAGTALYPAADAVLRQFCDLGIRQGICTNKPEAISRRIVEDLAIADYFEAVVGGDSTVQRKPHPAPLRACLEQIGASPQISMMIGDSAVDVETARALLMPVGIVSFGYARQPVSQLGADFLIHDLATVPDLIRDRHCTGLPLA